VLPVLCEVAAIDAVAVRILPSEDGQMGYAILDGDPDRTRSVRLATSPGRRSCPLAQVASVYSDGVDDRDGLDEVILKLCVAESTAHELINECRELGLLPPNPKHAPPGSESAMTVRYMTKVPEGFDLDRWLGIETKPGEHPGHGAVR
jgi:hypothetical protein